MLICELAQDRLRLIKIMEPRCPHGLALIIAQNVVWYWLIGMPGWNSEYREKEQLWDALILQRALVVNTTLVLVRMEDNQIYLRAAKVSPKLLSVDDREWCVNVSEEELEEVLLDSSRWHVDIRIFVVWFRARLGILQPPAFVLDVISGLKV
jgi:hypothetical protein